MYLKIFFIIFALIQIGQCALFNFFNNKGVAAKEKELEERQQLLSQRTTDLIAEERDKEIRRYMSLHPSVRATFHPPLSLTQTTPPPIVVVVQQPKNWWDKWTSW
ncbi:hypothetical protein SNEBB_000544 [Seison nebaliae]|nr:hypothetical protein SNEBB_000544 [Seison nebaliae]